jgi:hypothetical protein
MERRDTVGLLSGNTRAAGPVVSKGHTRHDMPGGTTRFAAQRSAAQRSSQSISWAQIDDLEKTSSRPLSISCAPGRSAS